MLRISNCGIIRRALKTTLLDDQNRLEFLEISGDGVSLETDAFIARARRRMPPVPSRFYESHLQLALAHPFKCKRHKRFSHAAPLKAGIYGNNVDLTHGVLRVRPQAEIA